MNPRRRLLLGAAAASGALATLPACSNGEEEQTAARALRQPFAPRGDTATRMREWVRYAALAPSSHNTQCWTFRCTPGRIAIEADIARRCPAVDPDDHHLFVSLGCAAENLQQAALADGHGAVFEPVIAGGPGGVVVSFEPTRPRRSTLFEAIPRRQCTRSDYDGQPLAASELDLLAKAGRGDGVRPILLTARPVIEQVLEAVLAGDAAQWNDPAFVAEIEGWIRFDADEAVRTGDGLYTAASGNPSVPRWLGSRTLKWFVTPTSEHDRCARQVRSSAGIAVFVSARNDRAHWVEAGRCYERFALQATALGIRNAMLNQAVEVAPVRSRFAGLLGLGASERPDLVVRFGRGPTLPWSMRRPVTAVLR